MSMRQVMTSPSPIPIKKVGVILNLYLINSISYQNQNEFKRIFTSTGFTAISTLNYDN